MIVTPERLVTNEFSKILDKVHQHGNLNRLVVDEVSLSMISENISLISKNSRHIVYQYAFSYFSFRWLS
jgi:hypothetical protein